MKRVGRIGLVFGSLALIACSGAGADGGDAESNATDESAIAGGAAPGGPTLPSADYVPTPAGAVHKSCVHALGEGDRVEDDGSITRHDGRHETFPPCAFAPPAHRAPSDDASSEVTASIDGWQEDAEFDAPAALGYLRADTVVPQPPSNYTGQTIFLFPALEGISSGGGWNILQPVVQYGPSQAGGGAYWSIASWFGGAAWGGHYYTSPNYRVAPGEAIRGIVYGNSNDCNSYGCLWGVSTHTPYGHTTITVRTGVAWRYAFGGVLEAYGATYCNQWPASNERFSNIVVQNWSRSTQYAPGWQNITDLTGCGFGVSSNATTVWLAY